MCVDTEISRNKLAKQFKPLVKKISNQFKDKSNFDYEEIEGFAWVGFSLALEKYDPSLSNMKFESYLAYSIRNAILNGMNKFSRTIKISFYNQKKLKSKGESQPTSFSIDKYFENEDHLINLGVEDSKCFENPWDILYKKISEKFDKNHAEILFSIYGLNGYKIEKGKDLAKKYNISGCLITKRIKKMVEFIKNDNELSDYLRDLL